MRTIIMSVLSMVMWIEAASAQSTFSVSVSRHSETEPLSDKDVKDILATASKMLQKNPGHSETEDDVACNVTFILNGPVRTFASPDTPAIVANESHRDQVHKDGLKSEGGVPINVLGGVHFHVKVVKEIKVCRGKPNSFGGCAFPAEFRSIIVVHPKALKNNLVHLLWAHEFGHLTGLGHRDDKFALMDTCSPLKDDQVRVNRNECSCFRSGPGSCLPLPPPLICP